MTRLNHRRHVGPADKFDLLGAAQFKFLTDLGLRENHKLLDVGCGCLRAGRLFIPYLQAGNYYGIEPHTEQIEAGILCEVGESLIKLRRPSFSADPEFNLTLWGLDHFDYILAHSVFTHATRAQVRQCLQSASQALHSEGRLVVTYNRGPANNRATAWSYPQGISYTSEFLQEQAAACKLLMTEHPIRHPTGQRWVVFRRK